ncbi:MAG: TIGR00159 family protein [Verrucomicrobia bacterium]|jgi:diadenylate cyclase|nr:TIGR00159 family protein [Verrucomicrobiota bacterium]
MDFFHTITPFVEIAIIAVMINYILSFFWNTRSMDLILGLLAFIFLFFLSSWLKFPVLHKIMLLVVNVAVIAIIIIFQPELRVALSKLSVKGKRYREITEFDKFLEQLAHSVYKMAEKQMGALIVLENEDSLEEYAKKAIVLHADFTGELLESIFSRYAPLHDGAVIIRDTKIVAASAILPLADTPHVQKTLGTRHRSAVGLSLITDALVVVISEESGKVSLARDGIITRGIKIDRFKGVIRSIFSNEEEGSFKTERGFWGWLKR